MAGMDAPSVWPLDIVLHEASGKLEVLWNDGLRGSLTGFTLRAACRCSQCESARRAGHPPVPESDLVLNELRPMGDIGLQLCFSDGHDRGIYPWAYLHELFLNTPARVAS